MTKHIIRFNEKEGARARLFCFPFAGGSAAAYRIWDQLLPEDVELCAVEIPGRVYMREAPAADMNTLIAAIYPEIAALLDKPFLFFGHSYGSSIAYEVTKKLQQEGKPLPKHLFVSSRRPPFMEDHRPPTAHLSDKDFIDVMQNIYKAIPEVVLKEEDLLKMMLPILKEDIRLNETYIGENSPLLEVPTTFFYGTEDDSEKLETLKQWKEVTSSSFAIRSFKGGHFFIDSAKQEVVPAILEKL